MPARKSPKTPKTSARQAQPQSIGKIETRKKKLTPKQAKFAENLLDPTNKGNATKAAIEAGYSPERARITAAENVTKSNIQEAIFHTGVDIYNVNSERLKGKIDKVLGRIERLIDAADAEMRDPDNAEEYLLAPRASEIKVVYLDHRRINQRGEPMKSTGLLSQLLERCDAEANVEILHHQNLAVDPRILMLKAAKELRESFSFVADLAGLKKQADQNPAQAERDRQFFLAELKDLREQGHAEAEAKAMLIDAIPAAAQYVN